jgi:hypothetical protein
MKQLGSCWTEVSWNFKCDYFSKKSVEKIQVSLKSDKNLSRKLKFHWNLTKNLSRKFKFHWNLTKICRENSSFIEIWQKSVEKIQILLKFYKNLSRKFKFHWNLTKICRENTSFIKIWQKSVEKFQVSLKSDKNLSRKFNFHWNLTGKAGTLHSDLRTFFITCCSFLLRMRNFSAWSCRENQSTHFVFDNFFLKNVPFMR